MALNNIIEKSFADHSKVIELVRGNLLGNIESIAYLLAQTLISGGTLFWCGNGGSAADSQHMAAELVGRFKKNRRALRSLALTTDTSILTCVANDYDYESIFSRQVEAMGRQGDVLIGISTSGDSVNVIRAFEVAKSAGIKTVALLGKDGGKCKVVADDALIIPSQNTARIQEAHILIGHVLCELIEKEMGFA
jgi:D-sedoheptulose 7-phosphate isomerase